MAAGHTFRDNQPMGHLGRMPIYMALILAIFHASCFFLTMPSVVTETGQLFREFLPIQTFKAGIWWEPFTYACSERGNLFALISIFFIYWSGVEVEKFFGRWTVLKLYLVLLLTAPLVSTLCWLGGYNGTNLLLYGSSTLSLGFLAAFATLYPRAELQAALSLRTVALICIAIRLVILARDRNGVGAFALLATCGVASLFILRLRHGPELSFTRLFQGLKSRPRLRVLPDPPRRKVVTTPLSDEPEESDVDALLDKIAKSGLDSLTTTERRKLEAARQELLKKERR
jgi:membrane associated rhomboid family serine protease